MVGFAGTWSCALDLEVALVCVGEVYLGRGVSRTAVFMASSVLTGTRRCSTQLISRSILTAASERWPLRFPSLQSRKTRHRETG